MKRKTLIIILCCEAVLLAALTLTAKRLPGAFSSVFAFPFEQIADALGALSATGRFGSGLAAALWVGLSAIPAAAATLLGRGKEKRPERISLFLLSGMLFLAYYGMANPMFFASAPELAKSVKGCLGVSVWAFAVLYLVLSLVRLFKAGSKERLLAYLRTAMCVLCVLLTAIAVISLTAGVVSIIASARPSGDELAGLLLGEDRFSADAVVGIMLLVTEALPFLLDVVILMRVLDVLDIAAGEEQDGLASATGRLSGLCCTALGVITALSVIGNVVQLAAMRRLSNVNVSANIPVASIVLVLMVLLFSRLLVENKRLRDDDSLFI